jgi:hypothetical protein
MIRRTPAGRKSGARERPSPAPDDFSAVMLWVALALTLAVAVASFFPG